MPKIILITASFPYLPGEQFLETEVKYYTEHKDIDFTIMPINSHDKIREIDKSIKLDTYLIDNMNKSLLHRLLYLGKSMLSKLFYKEIASNLVFTTSSIKSFMGSVSAYQNFYDLFDNYFKYKEDLSDTIVYTYWNDTFTYALQSLKNKYGYKLVSRIHGYDIYKERRPDCYKPLKHLFTDNIDRIFTITQSANEYLSRTYGFKSETLELSRLGVDDNFIKCNSSLENHFSIASCSFLVDVKRVDKIIDAIAILSKQYPLITFEWNHIGSGPLEDKLKQYAQQKLSNMSNVKYEFLGHLDNQEVYAFYKNNAVDMFINVSESEGVPVSIMEAMSCHIPIVAPNVGGISDMIIDKNSGRLLSEKCEVDELLEALSEVEFFKNEVTREKAYQVYLEKYDAKKNYTEFIETLKGL
jgi:glycosyltransferase involved in cell wall biosynthesis